MIDSVHSPILKELTEFLRVEGVPLPDSTPEKPVGDFRNIPEGSKLSDEEVANLLQLSQPHPLKITYSVTLKDFVVRKGWLKQPPSFPANAYLQKI